MLEAKGLGMSLRACIAKAKQSLAFFPLSAPHGGLLQSGLVSDGLLENQ